MSVDFDFHELTDFNRDVLEHVTRTFPSKAKTLMGRAGSALVKQVKAEYKSETKKKTGNLLAGVKRGRPFIYAGSEFQVRVYNKAPHAHLIEHGHRMIDWRTGKRTPKRERVPGKHIVGKVSNRFPGEFEKICDKFVNHLLEKGFY